MSTQGTRDLPEQAPSSESDAVASGEAEAEASAPEASGEANAATRKRFEIAFGLTLTIFAAVLAVNELFSSKYGDDELRLASEKAGAYLWYQSKGLKESISEGHRELLQSLIDGETIRSEQVERTRARIGKLDQDLARYRKEKKEILLGSAKVGREGWVQDVDGKLGTVVGVKELEAQLAVLGAAGDRYDLATLFLQMCIVLGGLGLLMKQVRIKWLFFGAMVSLGGLGFVCMMLAFVKVWSM